MSIDLDNLELFVRSAALGAIGRAGEALGYSATNASQRIQKLETQLGVTLFHRTTRSITLTPDGEVLLSYATQILQNVEDARTALADADELNGKLRVTTSATLAQTHIIPFVPEFLAQYPGLELELHFSDGVVDIVEQGYDLAIRVGNLAASSLLAKRISDNPIRLVASPQYIDKHGEPQTAQELASHPCLQVGRKRSLKLVGPDGQVHTINPPSPVTVNLGEAIAQWVKAGVAIAPASLWHAGPDIRAGDLCLVMPEYRLLDEPKIWSVRPPGGVMPPRVRVFLDYVDKRINELNLERYGDLL